MKKVNRARSESKSSAVIDCKEIAASSVMYENRYFNRKIEKIGILKNRSVKILKQKKPTGLALLDWVGLFGVVRSVGS